MRRLKGMLPAAWFIIFILALAWARVFYMVWQEGVVRLVELDARILTVELTFSVTIAALGLFLSGYYWGRRQDD